MLENVAQFVESVYDDLCDGCHASLKTESELLVDGLDLVLFILIFFYYYISLSPLQFEN